jgi:hypothetical protein
MSETTNQNLFLVIAPQTNNISYIERYSIPIASIEDLTGNESAFSKVTCDFSLSSIMAMQVISEPFMFLIAQRESKAELNTHHRYLSSDFIDGSRCISKVISEKSMEVTLLISKELASVSTH